MSKQKTKPAASAEVVRLRQHVSMVILVSVMSATLWAQIPEHSKWGIAFPQVEAAAKLSDIRAAPPEAFEARLMLPAAVHMQPMMPIPFLRLWQTDGTVRAQLFLFWAPVASGGRQPAATDLCRDGICVTPIEIKEQRNWREVLATLAQQDACPKRENSEMVTACPHCDTLWIKTTASGKYREQFCSESLPGTPAGALLQLMNTAARVAR